MLAIRHSPFTFLDSIVDSPILHAVMNARVGVQVPTLIVFFQTANQFWGKRRR